MRKSEDLGGPYSFMLRWIADKLSILPTDPRLLRLTARDLTLLYYRDLHARHAELRQQAETIRSPKIAEALAAIEEVLGLADDIKDWADKNAEALERALLEGEDFYEIE